MKSLSCNPIYMLFILISVLQFNAFINSFTFMPKYLEQQYGKSTAEIVFLIGMKSHDFLSSTFPSHKDMISSQIMQVGGYNEIEICWVTLANVFFIVFRQTKKG